MNSFSKGKVSLADLLELVSNAWLLGKYDCI